MTGVTQAALLEATRRHRRPGISAPVALILAYSELAAAPLDPERFDDSAVVLRAERLLVEDLPVAEALKTAVREFVTFREGAP